MMSDREEKPTYYLLTYSSIIKRKSANMNIGIFRFQQSILCLRSGLLKLMNILACLCEEEMTSFHSVDRC
jgi:hypothetical protein